MIRQGALFGAKCCSGPLGAPCLERRLRIRAFPVGVTTAELQQAEVKVYSGTSEKGTLWGNGLCPL